MMCVLTDHPTKPDCHATHIIGAAPAERLLPKGSEICQDLKRYLTGAMFDGTSNKLVADSTVPLLPDFASWYDERLAVTMRARFNSLWANGHMVVDEDGCVQFSADALNCTNKRNADLKLLNGKRLRKPTDPIALKKWPTADVFRLQRLLAPHFRASCRCSRRFLIHTAHWNRSERVG